MAVENERADASRDGRLCLVFRDDNLRPERGREKTKHIFSFQLTTSRMIDNNSRLKHNLLNMVSHYMSTCCPRRSIGVVVDKLTVSLLFVVWIREFHFWSDGFIMVSVAESKRT